MYDETLLRSILCIPAQPIPRDQIQIFREQPQEMHLDKLFVYILCFGVGIAKGYRMSSVLSLIRENLVSFILYEHSVAAYSYCFTFCTLCLISRHSVLHYENKQFIYWHTVTHGLNSRFISVCLLCH